MEILTCELLQVNDVLKVFRFKKIIASTVVIYNSRKIEGKFNNSMFVIVLNIIAPFTSSYI